MTYSLFVSCPRNIEYMLEEELTALGLNVTKVSPMGVYGSADLATIYDICLWSRLANRVQLILFSGVVDNLTTLNQLCKEYAWDNIFDVDKTMAVEFHGECSFINNTMYGAQVVKDGVVDYFKTKGVRPSVDRTNPNVLLHAFIKKELLTVSLDLTGYSLHQRGYRLAAGRAPLKENLAAALLLRANWPELAKKGYALADPFCGSATLLIEGSMMATNTAPGLFRNDQAFQYWLGHDAELWQSRRALALAARTPLSNFIAGYDSDRKLLDIARDNIDHIDIQGDIQLKHQMIKDFQTLPGPGLMIANPPYGERLRDPLTLLPLYEDIGKALFYKCQGWQAAIFTSNASLAQAIGLKKDKIYAFFNGPQAVKLYCITVNEQNELKVPSEKKLNAYTEALYNRLMKQKKKLGKWAQQHDVSCYRLYDADLPDYAFAIDIYGEWVHVQEYAAPKEIPVHKTERRVLELMQLLPKVLQVPAQHIVLKQRSRQRGTEQYQPIGRKKQLLKVNEGAALFHVNLHDYLDSGLFLDHRPLRLMFYNQLKGKRLLNCFCYTGAFSVHAALKGLSTCNVDLSNTYLEWAKDNFTLNNIPLSKHQFVRADCLTWLAQCNEQFDTILLDPPSFSNSKKMASTLDIQRDQETLIDLAMALLSAQGELYFSNNLRTFKLSPALAEKYQVSDITAKTIGEDFKRSKHAHRCYLIQHNL